MRTFEIDEDILETLLEAAYRRGASWIMDNAASPEFIGKAARDYADKSITEAFGREEPIPHNS